MDVELLHYFGLMLKYQYINMLL